MRVFGPLALAFFGVVAGTEGAQARYDAEAVRLNNRGVALMGQQFNERASGEFAKALQKDPKLAQAAINEGIAMLSLQRLDEAKKYLEQAATMDPDNPQVWYNLGLVEHAGNELEAALTSFERAAKLDPRDADSYYFQGDCYFEMKQYDKAIAVLKQALEIDPHHASAVFVSAQALQRSGHKEDATPLFHRFKELTGSKVGSPIGLAYGEQGHYSTVTAVEEP